MKAEPGIWKNSRVKLSEKKKKNEGKIGRLVEFEKEREMNQRY
jgi:hypothetical protein